MASPTFNAISDQPPGGAPVAPMMDQGQMGAGPGGDALAQALAAANSQLQAALEGQVQITPEAENQLKVMLVLIQQLAQKAQAGPGAPPPGGPGPMSSPGTPTTSGLPGGGQ